MPVLPATLRGREEIRPASRLSICRRSHALQRQDLWCRLGVAPDHDANVDRASSGQCVLNPSIKKRGSIAVLLQCELLFVHAPGRIDRQNEGQVCTTDRAGPGRLCITGEKR